MKAMRSLTTVLAIGAACVSLTLAAACRGSASSYKTFPTPEDAVRALIDAAKKGPVDNLVAIFAPEGQALIDGSDPVRIRRNREVFTVAAAERWKLVDQGQDTKVLVIGKEEWPFPVPLVKASGGWHFDVPAGKEEVLARRVGRNELAAIRICKTYVAAQQLYAETGHDGLPAKLYARTLGSDQGKQNGLYWPAERNQPRSPLGDLMALAGEPGKQAGTAGKQPQPFHGYYFKILTAQGPGARGGAKDYIVNGQMSGGFALVAWPAEYDASGVMTFIVNADNDVHEKDLGPETDAAARAMTTYDPDSSWTSVK
jgi:hypothetical protein